jgi:hypothetical protein
MNNAASELILALVAATGWVAWYLQWRHGASYERIEESGTLHTVAHWRAIRAGVRLAGTGLELEIKSMDVEAFEVLVRKFETDRGLENIADSDWSKYLHWKLSKQFEVGGTPLSMQEVNYLHDDQEVSSSRGSRGVDLLTKTGRK